MRQFPSCIEIPDKPCPFSSALGALVPELHPQTHPKRPFRRNVPRAGELYPAKMDYIKLRSDIHSFADGFLDRGVCGSWRICRVGAQNGLTGEMDRWLEQSSCNCTASRTLDIQMTDPNPANPGPKPIMIQQRISDESGSWHEPLHIGSTEDSLQADIGIQLRAVYERMISEPVPDRFLDLLDRLDRAKSAK
jgi:hypothetical protein